MEMMSSAVDQSFLTTSATHICLDQYSLADFVGLEGWVCWSRDWIVSPATLPQSH